MQLQLYLHRTISYNCKKQLATTVETIADKLAESEI